MNSLKEFFSFLTTTSNNKKEEEETIIIKKDNDFHQLLLQDIIQKSITHHNSDNSKTTNNNNNNSNSNNNNITFTNDILIRLIIHNRVIFLKIFSNVYMLSRYYTRCIKDANLPIINNYHQMTDVSWMIDNGYVGVLHSKLDRNEFLQMEGEIGLDTAPLEKLFRTKDYGLIEKLVKKYRMHFYTENSIDLACCSGRLDVVQLIISIHDPQNLPITKNAILNAMKAGSLELVQFLDTTFDSCNIAITMIGSISKNSDVISYYLGKISIGGGRVDGLMILSSMDINLIKNHFHSTTTFINATTMLDFIKKATLFSPSSYHFELNGFPKNLKQLEGNERLMDNIDNILLESQEYFKKFNQLIPLLFKQQQQNDEKININISKLMNNINQNNNPTIYQPLFNILLVYEYINLDSILQKHIDTIHRIVFRAITILGLVDKTIFSFIIDRLKEVNNLSMDEYFNQIIGNWTNIDQLNLILEIDPSLYQFKFINLNSTRITIRFQEEVLERLMEIGIIQEDVLLTDWRLRVVDDLATVKYILSRNTAKQNCSMVWDVSRFKFGPLSKKYHDETAKLLIEAGFLPQYVDSMHGLVYLCTNHSTTSNFLIKYLVESCLTYDVYALMGAIQSQNWDLFDYIIKVENVREYPFFESEYYSKEFLKPIKYLIAINDFDRCIEFIKRLNNKSILSLVPNLCVGNIQFFSQFVNQYPQSLNLQKMVERTIYDCHVPFMLFLIDQYPTFFQQQADLIDLFGKACSVGSLSIMKILFDHYGCLIDNSFVGLQYILVAINRGHVNCLAYLDSLKKFQPPLDSHKHIHYSRFGYQLMDIFLNRQAEKEKILNNYGNELLF
ncbi:hypothetical protein DFA_03411 [Cavenderia fasciculata]|uniref:Ankyrin repeat-containing protein n=1 Tax=Cavenderia fasciculata TaxID=261658 RepID=F4PHH9_CACFS|nr:uncharacterized protein DFA_03411 [Cavenderia fasciculata]EGG25163.1 hypothetical protein DFA_03411 [Cavenderia fasciculata]|eukprot:XP_004363014.1 hypothetical protein DFA_03411 [Cavenderia fasciculata]